uniref:Transposase, MuDR, MULE transposase domain protein n=1 Tax=Tanacetum cinerariifolium TaxID=118510 RepID=A0A6L2M418_TANCI|nr:transposase, MuDR, MULE transposase domain protein [Tanacetum cinerariifolium]
MCLSEVQKGQIFDNKESLILAVRLKAVSEGKHYGIQQVRGSPYEAFEMLPYYCYNLENKNEGTVTRIKTDDNGVFEMLFIAIGASIRTFLNYLRPVLMIDAAHLKGLYKGTNLVVVAMDGNNQIVPIAFGSYALSGMKQIKNDYHTNVLYDIAKVVGKLHIVVAHTPIDLSAVLIPNDGSFERSNPENVRLTVLMKPQEALDDEAILEEQMLALMYHFADRFMDRRVEINNLIVLHDHPLIDYGKYALGCMTGADMKKCVELKGVRDDLLRSMEEKRQLQTIETCKSLIA